MAATRSSSPWSGPARPGRPGRKRIRVNGIARRASSLSDHLRVVVFAPEEMLLVAGSPSLRRAALDQLAAARSPRYADAQTTYTRTLQQRNSLLRAIREEGASRDELRYWDTTFVEAGGEIVAQRLQLLADLAEPLAAAHAEIAPDEAAESALRIRYVTNAPASPVSRRGTPSSGASPRRPTRRSGTARRSSGPHRDDLAFELAGRDLAGFASRGQQRTAILAFKLAELDLLTALDGRPPLLLLDDVFSELDPERRAHLVRRIAALPQAFITTTTPDDLDPALRAIATSWEVTAEPGGATPSGGRRPVVTARKRPMVRLGDLIPDAARALGLDEELRRSRAMATFEAIVAERVPSVAGACRVTHLEGFALDVEADAPIVAQELRLHQTELLAAFIASPGGLGVRELRVHVRRTGPRV